MTPTVVSLLYRDSSFQASSELSNQFPVSAPESDEMIRYVREQKPEMIKNRNTNSLVFTLVIPQKPAKLRVDAVMDSVAFGCYLAYAEPTATLVAWQYQFGKCGLLLDADAGAGERAAIPVVHGRFRP
jgi:hypothetical protein